MRSSAIAGAFCLLAASTAAHAKAPKQGSYDWSEMQPYRQFIQVMDHCCSIADGRIPYTQKIVSEKTMPGSRPGEEHVERSYRVFVLERSFVTDDPADEDSNAFKKLFKQKGEYYEKKFGLWVDVPPGKVISEEDAKARCKPIIEANREARLKDPSVAEHTCNPPIIPILWLKKDGSAYCFWPEKPLGALDARRHYAGPDAVIPTAGLRL